MIVKHSSPESGCWEETKSWSQSWLEEIMQNDHVNLLPWPQTHFSMAFSRSVICFLTMCAERGATMFASSRVLRASLTEYIISIDYSWELWHSILPMHIPSWHSRESTYLKRDRKATIVGHCCWAEEGDKCSNNWKMLSRSTYQKVRKMGCYKWEEGQGKPPPTRSEGTHSAMLYPSWMWFTTSSSLLHNP